MTDEIFNPTLVATLQAMREEWTAPIIAERDMLRGLVNWVQIETAQGGRRHAANAEQAESEFLRGWHQGRSELCVQISDGLRRLLGDAG